MINMSQMKKKRLWSKFGLSFKEEGRHDGEDDVNRLVGKPNVNEEYKEAFRTKSYIEMCNKVQGQHEIRLTLDEEKSSSSSSSFSSSSSSVTSSPPTRHVHLSEYLLEPRNETLINSNLHPFLDNFFQISREACQICESLLTSVHWARSNYRSIKSVAKLIKQVPDNTNWTHNQYYTAYKNLASFALHRNPFSTMTPEKFHDLHKIHTRLLEELMTTNYRKTRRRAKFGKFFRRTLSVLLVVGCGALAIALIILALHSMGGVVVAVPGLAFWSFGLFIMKKMRRPDKRHGKIWGKGLHEQLDIAARGVYILINDFDTISRVVQRLNDEIEHRKFVADICVRKGKNEMLKEVVKEFKMHESCFVEQLEELEKQIYLCFLDINRSRMLLLQEMAKYSAIPI